MTDPAPYRILAVAATPFFVDRGGHIHIYEPIRALQAQGHQVVMTTYHIGRDLPDVTAHRILNIPWYSKTDAGPSYQKPFLALLLLYKTLQVAREFKPDVLHAHGWDSLWVAWWVWKLRGIPFIFDMQGSFSGEIAEHGYAKKGSLFYRSLSAIEQLSLRAAPVVVASSTQIYNEAKTRFGLRDEQIIPIFDGVDTQTFSPERFPPDPALRARLNLPDKKIVVFMGLLKTYQGVDDMIEAARVLVHDLGFEEVHFLVLGFPDEDHYRQMAAQKGLADYMTFTGKVPYHETGHYLALADLAIAPKISMTEGDAKIYFYMAMGLPVVAYRRPASEEILGDLGLYAEYHNAADLGRVLHATLSQPDLLQQRGAENRHKAVNEYSWEAVAQKIVGAYQKAIQTMTPVSPPPKSKALWQWVRLLMGLLGLLLLLRVVDFGDVADSLRDANWLYLAPAWGLMMLSTAIKTARWHSLMQQNKLNMSFGNLFGTYLIGTFYGQFLPGSSAGGDAMRMAESSVDSGKPLASIASVVIERGIGLTSILTTSSLIILFAHPGEIPRLAELVIHTISLTGIVGLLALRFGWFINAIKALLERFKWVKLAERFYHLGLALQEDLRDGRLVAWMVTLSLLANLCSMSAYYLALLAVTDPVPYLSFISIVALIVTLEAIPLTPGSLGVREGAYVFFLGFLEIARAPALSVGLLIRILTWTQALMGGAVLLYRALIRQNQLTSKG